MHDSPDAPLVDIQWEFTDQDFMPGEQFLNSKYYREVPEISTFLGEQWEERPPTNAISVPIGLLGGHQCGPADWFANGQPWPYLGPPVVYDEDWVPTCCPRYYGLTVGAHPESEVTTGPVDVWGLTCCESAGAVLGDTYSGSLPDGTVGLHWYQFAVVPGNYQATWSMPTAAFLTAFMGVNTGPACDDTPTTLVGTVFQGTFPFTITTAGVICVAVEHGTGNPPAAYTLKVEAV